MSMSMVFPVPGMVVGGHPETGRVLFLIRNIIIEFLK